MLNANIVEEENSLDLNKVAIIGMACRFPGANNPEQFWQTIVEGVEAIRHFSDSELSERGVASSDLLDPTYVKAARTLDDVSHFDAAFFGFTPQEARLMDPQQRIFIECCQEVFERAGYPLGQKQDHVGVFAGSAASTYMLNNVLGANGYQDINTTLHHAAHGNDKDYLTTMVSYKLNLGGPSMSINTACSSALLAIVQACKSLLSYDCDMALAGGVRIEVPNEIGYRHHKGGILSPDGRCFAFDKQAQGTVFGDGAGVVLLKRLADAQADGDTIYAVVAGFASNNDGADKAGFSAPGVNAQQAVISEALAYAEFAPSSIGYLEAHGTGTVVGDPIEFAALQQVFEHTEGQSAHCALGSVKANIGHLNTAAGVAGFMKTALVLHHQTLPPQINFSEVNPAIDLAESAFFIPTSAQAWPAGDLPRRAGVSAFGIGGSNVHIVLEEAPPRPARQSDLAPQLLLLSAKTPAALNARVKQLQQHIRQYPQQELADIAYTLQQGRQHYQQRAYCVCSDTGMAEIALDSELTQQSIRNTAMQTVFMFPGQGSQYLTMGQGLYQHAPVYRDSINHCLEILAQLPEQAIVAQVRLVLLANGEQQTQAQDLLANTEVAQPALFVVQYSLAQLWLSHGIQPQAMIGHSLGEYVAACLAGVMSLHDALQLVVLRAALMQQMPAGAMLAVALGEQDLAVYLAQAPDCVVAAVNSPVNCVVAGSPTAIDALAARLQHASVEAKRLAVSHAFHSPMVDSIVPQFEQVLQTMSFQPPQIPYISNVSGTWIGAQQATSVEYWLQHLRGTVLFAQGLATLLAQEEACVLIEVGPGSSLTQLAYKQISPASHQQRNAAVCINSMRHPQSQVHDYANWLDALGKLWRTGQVIDWQALHAQAQRVVLPTYPFERSRHWIEAQAPLQLRDKSQDLRKQKALEDWLYLPSWQMAGRTATASPLIKAEKWLLLCEQAEHPLASACRKLGAQVLVLSQGAHFSANEQGYQLNPLDAHHWQQLAAQLRTKGWQADQVIFAWGISQTGVPKPIPSAENTSQNLQILLHVLQALSEKNYAAQARLRILCEQAFAVTGVESIQAEQALLVGAAAVVANEMPHLRSQCIDLAADAGATGYSELLAELSTSPEQPLVALRHQRRWLPCYLEQSSSTASNPSLRAGGSYLITGGFGGLGQVLARWLAAKGPVTLALLHRQPLPPASQHAALLADSTTSSKLREQLLFIQELQQSGAQVLCLCADVSEQASIDAALQQVVAQTGKLTGVFHTAGVASTGLIEGKQVPAMLAAIAAKVQGTQYLTHSLQKHGLPEFVMLFSSIAAVLGGAGQFEYSAANAYLDAFAQAQAQQADEKASACRWLAINWDTWQEVGMARNAQVAAYLQQLKEASLQTAISNLEGTALLERIFSVPAQAQLLVSTQHFAARRAGNHSRNLSKPLVSSGTTRPELEQEYLQAISVTENRLSAIWQRLIGYEKIGRKDKFFELGGDSLLATKLVAAINAEFNCDIGVRDFIESADIETLAQLLDALSTEDNNDETLEEQTW